MRAIEVGLANVTRPAGPNPNRIFRYVFGVFGFGSNLSHPNEYLSESGMGQEKWVRSGLDLVIFS